jgi:hypothetical protein
MSPGRDPAERLLRDMRPEPRADFVRGLEASLVARSRGRERFRVLLAGTGLCASLAALTLLLGVFGLLPGGLGESRRSQADNGCQTVIKVRKELRPVLVVNDKGHIRTEQRSTTVRTPVKRCR